MKKLVLALLLLLGASGLAAVEPAYVYQAGPSYFYHPSWIGAPPASTSVDALLYLSGAPTGVEYSVYSSSSLPIYVTGAATLASTLAVTGTVTHSGTVKSAQVELAVANVTGADDGAGTKPAVAIPITAPVATCTCNDATGCAASIAEPTPTSGYARVLTIVSAGTGNCEVADSSGVVELPGGTTIALGPNDTLSLIYANSTWLYTATGNN